MKIQLQYTVFYTAHLDCSQSPDFSRKFDGIEPLAYLTGSHIAFIYTDYSLGMIYLGGGSRPCPLDTFGTKMAARHL